MTTCIPEKHVAEAVARRMGELCRKGRTVFYAILDGGVYVESPDPKEVAAYIAAEEARSLAIALARRVGLEVAR